MGHAPGIIHADHQADVDVPVKDRIRCNLMQPGVLVIDFGFGVRCEGAAQLGKSAAVTALLCHGISIVLLLLSRRNDRVRGR